MIEQVSVMNNEAIVANRIKRSSVGRSYITPEQWHAEEAEIRKTIKEGEDELNRLLAEGYKIIGFTPFLVGHGTNFVLYKPDAKEEYPLLIDISDSEMARIVALAHKSLIDPFCIPQMSSDEADLNYRAAQAMLPFLGNPSDQAKVKSFIDRLKETYRLGGQ